MTSYRKVQYKLFKRYQLHIWIAFDSDYKQIDMPQIPDYFKKFYDSSAVNIRLNYLIESEEILKNNIIKNQLRKIFITI